ncbi:hypothetical protein HAN_3g495 (nucleomorph) [Hemiselmis andersenii]|uniref:Uncharacterized protein n=1 Tax=Hemiselmis andersenii TaxID=464988 RepID=A9BLB4_HEMAN|nr:hypothetical protein HAN_3g495 [Hemiselmis andersenii]ABW98297.1 hypothetical protein HAN_3g495 [Hemiselmis andersenii]
MNVFFCFPNFSPFKLNQNLPKKVFFLNFLKNSKRKKLTFCYLNINATKKNPKICVETKNDQFFFCRFPIKKNFKEQDVEHKTIATIKQTKLRKILRNFNQFEISTEFPSMKISFIVSIKNIQEISFLFLKFSKFFPKNINSLILSKFLREENKTLIDVKDSFFFSKNLIYSSNFSNPENKIKAHSSESFFCFFKNFSDDLIFNETFSILSGYKKSHPQIISFKENFFFENIFYQKTFVNFSKFFISRKSLYKKPIGILFMGKRWIEKKEKRFFLIRKNELNSLIFLERETQKKFLILCSELKIKKKKNFFFLKIKNNLMKEHFGKFQNHPFLEFKIGGEWNFSKIDFMTNFLKVNLSKKNPIKNLKLANQVKEIKTEMDLMVNYRERKIRSIFSLGKNKVIKNCNILFLFEKIPKSQFFKISIGLNESFMFRKKKIFFFLRIESLKFFSSPSDFPADLKQLTNNFYYQNFPIFINFEFFKENDYPILFIDPFLIDIRKKKRKKKILLFSLNLLSKTQKIKINDKILLDFIYYLSLSLFQFVFLDFKTKKIFKTKSKKVFNLSFYIFWFDENFFLKKIYSKNFSEKKLIKNFLNTQKISF